MVCVCVCVWEFRPVYVFACVLGASSGDTWKEKKIMVHLCHVITCNSSRVQAWNSMTRYIRFVFILRLRLLYVSPWVLWKVLYKCYYYLSLHVQKCFSPSASMSLLAGCSIIHRQRESRLAQQGAYQLTTYSYRAVKMKKNYMMYKRDTHTHVNLCIHSNTERNFRTSELNICLHAYSVYAHTHKHTLRTQRLHTLLLPTLII